jgi:hypothetical protein
MDANEGVVQAVAVVGVATGQGGGQGSPTPQKPTVLMSFPQERLSRSSLAALPMVNPFPQIHISHLSSVCSFSKRVPSACLTSFSQFCFPHGEQLSSAPQPLTFIPFVFTDETGNTIYVHW